MKKAIKIFVFILSLLFISIESYWYFENDGNLIVFIQNQSDSIDEIPIKVTFDTEIIFDSTIYRLDYFPQEMPLSTWPGSYSLEVTRKDLETIAQQNFTLALVTWVVINVTTEDIKIEQHLIPPLFQ